MRILTPLLIMSLILLQCKPTTKGETEKHDRIVQDIATLKTGYSAFGKFLDEDLANGNKAWNDALAVSGDEKKAEAMKAANETLNSKLVERLGEYSSKLEGVKRAYDGLPQKVSTAANSRIKSALNSQGEAEKIMSNPDVSSRDSALKTLDSAIGKLISARSDLDEAKKIDSPKPDKKKK